MKKVIDCIYCGPKSVHEVILVGETQVVACPKHPINSPPITVTEKKIDDSQKN